MLPRKLLTFEGNLQYYERDDARWTVKYQVLETENLNFERTEHR